VELGRTASSSIQSADGHGHPLSALV